jgi:HEAT repeat protein
MGAAARGILGALVLLAVAGPAVSGDSLQTLTDRLASSEAGERAEAACGLGQRGPSAVAAVDELVALLSDSVRVGPIECGMSPWLKKLVVSKPEEWRKFETSPGREAAKALARIGQPALQPLLATLSSSTSAVARANAAYGVGEMEPREGRAEALARLMQALKDDDVGVRMECAHALGEIEDPEAVPALLAAIRDKAAPVRGASAWALGEIEDPRAAEPLMRTLWDTDAEVRSQAAWALGELEDSRAVEGLMGALAKDSDGRVRRQAAWALGEIEDARAVVVLVQALRDRDREVRRQAAWALGEIESPEAVEPLVGALRDEDTEVRQQSAWALGEIADPRAASPLAKALKDANPEVRRQAAWALGELKSQE